MRITSKRHLRKNQRRLDTRSELPGVRVTYPDRGHGKVVRYFSNGQYVVGSTNFAAVYSISFL